MCTNFEQKVNHQNDGICKCTVTNERRSQFKQSNYVVALHHHELARRYPAVALGCHELARRYPAVALGCQELTWGYPDVALDRQARAGTTLAWSNLRARRGMSQFAA